MIDRDARTLQSGLWNTTVAAERQVNAAAVVGHLWRAQVQDERLAPGGCAAGRKAAALRSASSEPSKQNSGHQTVSHTLELICFHACTGA